MENLIDILSEIVEALKNIAPEIYKIFYKQALAKGIVELAVGVFFIVVAVVLFKVYMKIKNKEYDASMLFIPIVLLSIAALIVIINGSLQVINPDYYAIQLLIGQITGK